MARPGQHGIDERAFEEILSDHLDALFRHAMRLNRNHAADAEDLLQDAVLRAFRKRSDLREVDSARAWLFTILTRTHLNRARSAVRRGETLVEDLADGEFVRALGEWNPQALPDENTDRTLLRQVLRKALEALDPELRVVVLLADVEGFRQKDVAAMLELPEGTVASRLFRARRELRKSLEPHEIGRQGGIA
jgi:RNA polymerase sigma-70 factor, ECF subfamily